jgi:hypothetical protein
LSPILQKNIRRSLNASSHTSASTQPPPTKCLFKRAKCIHDRTLRARLNSLNPVRLRSTTTAKFAYFIIRSTCDPKNKLFSQIYPKRRIVTELDGGELDGSQAQQPLSYVTEILPSQEESRFEKIVIPTRKNEFEETSQEYDDSSIAEQVTHH